jgi:hypothetical protein
MTLAYLASPYSHPDPLVKQMRLAIVNRVAAELLSQGMLIFSPLTYSVPLSQAGAHKGWVNWKEFDFAMIARCDKIIVLKLPGWEESTGVNEEIAYAKELGLPIEWMEAPAFDLRVGEAAVGQVSPNS